MTKAKIIGWGFGVAATAFVLWWFYKEGKKDASVQQADLPPDDTNGSPETESRLLQIAGNIYNDIKGLNAVGHKISVYEDALALSDYDFVRMYNLWNIKYSKTIVAWYSAGVSSLTEAIRNEPAIPFTQWETIKRSMLTRLSKLNCI